MTVAGIAPDGPSMRLNPTRLPVPAERWHKVLASLHRYPVRTWENVYYRLNRNTKIAVAAGERLVQSFCDEATGQVTETIRVKPNVKGRRRTHRGVLAVEVDPSDAPPRTGRHDEVICALAVAIVVLGLEVLRDRTRYPCLVALVVERVRRRCEITDRRVSPSSGRRRARKGNPHDHA